MWASDRLKSASFCDSVREGYSVWFLVRIESRIISVLSKKGLASGLNLSEQEYAAPLRRELEVLGPGGPRVMQAHQPEED